MSNKTAKKILSWNQSKYMLFIVGTCIVHFVIEGFFFGFNTLMDTNSVIYYIQQTLSNALFFPLFMVLTIKLQDRIHIFMDGKKTIIYLIYMIPVAIILYIVFFVFAIVQNVMMMADLSVMFLAAPFVAAYLREWYDDLFIAEKS